MLGQIDIDILRHWKYVFASATHVFRGSVVFLSISINFMLLSDSSPLCFIQMLCTCKSCMGVAQENYYNNLLKFMVCYWSTAWIFRWSLLYIRPKYQLFWIVHWHFYFTNQLFLRKPIDAPRIINFSHFMVLKGSLPQSK